MELKQANSVRKDILFKKIGVDVALHEGSCAFKDPIPSKGLAVSNRFGITFFVHSEGFTVSKTSKLVELAQQEKEKRNGHTAQHGCYVDVSVPEVHILSLSKDELTLAVCHGECIVDFYDVPNFVHKLDKSPYESRDIPEAHIKDLSWCPADDGSYFLLSKEGQLYRGQIGSNPKCVVEKNVVTASWSPDGKHFAFAMEDRSLHFKSSTFTDGNLIKLPAKLGGDEDSPSLHVESIRWVRPDGMLVAYTETNEDGEEVDCPLLLLASEVGDLAKESGTTGFAFYNIFPSIDPLIIPTGSGPYMLTEYLKLWEMAVAANRRSIDDHIVILGWISEEHQHEALNIELNNDSWIPRIELQENGVDNVLLGLAFDLTTINLELTDPRDDSGDTKLPACPVLMCLSLGGKLSLFSVARLERTAKVAELVSPPSEIPDSNRHNRMVFPTKASIEVAASPSNLETASKFNSDPLQARSRQAEERVEDEPSISSSGTQREEDQSDDDEVLSQFSVAGPVSGKEGNLTRAQDKSLADKESNSTSLNEKLSLQLQTPGASALSSLASTGGSNKSSLITVKSAPSGLDQIQPTEPTPQPPALLTRTVTQVQPTSVQAPSSSQNTPFSATSSGGPRLAPSWGTVSSGHLGNDKSSRSFTPKTTSAFSQHSLQREHGLQTGVQKVSTIRSATATPGRSFGASEVEAGFILELEELKRMSDEAENMMAYIEGRSERSTNNQPPCFTKQSLEELELGIRTLAENCKTVKERVEEERKGVANLQDEGLRVEAWRIYTQSLAGQAADSRYQDLWSRRKLPPELDVKRKRVIQAEQTLKQQIALVEEHVHHLELANRKRQVGISGGKNIVNRQSNSGRSQSVQNLYSTVNGLLTSADRLSQQVAQQMEALNISSEPATAMKILKSVGLSADDSPCVQIRPSPNGLAPSPHARHRLSYSPSSKPDSLLATLATPPRRQIPSDSGIGAPSITRRRRDSMDGVRAMAGGASPKTTIERVAQIKPMQQLKPLNSSSTSFVKHARQRSSQELNEEGTGHPRQVRRVFPSHPAPATSSPATSGFLSSLETKTYNSGPSATSGISTLQGSHSSTSWQEQHSGDGRPESKRTVSRSGLSFGEKSGPAFASRFAPPSASTISASSTTISSSNATSNPPTESLFKWANSRSPTSASSFSFVCTPATTKANNATESAAPNPSGKPVSNFGSHPSSPGMGMGSLTFSSSLFNSNQTHGNLVSGRSGTENNSKFVPEANLKPASDSDKQEKVEVVSKPASAGTTPFSRASSYQEENWPSRSSFGGGATMSSTTTSIGLPLNLSSNKIPGQKEGEAEAKTNETKLALPLTPPSQPSYDQSGLNRPLGSLGTLSSTIASTALLSPPRTTIGTPSPTERPLPSPTQMFTSAAVPTTPVQPQHQPSHISSLLSRPMSPSTPIPSSSPSPLDGMMNPPAPNPTPATQFVFPAANAPAPAFTPPSILTSDLDEEDMEEEQLTTGATTSLGGFNLGGLLGSMSSTSEVPKSNFFGTPSPFGTQQSSPTFSSSSSPQGQLFRPAAFNLPSAQSPPQPSSTFGFGGPSQQGGNNSFGSAFGGASSNPLGGTLFGASPAASSPGFGSPAQPGGGGFGQRAQLGPGQQALGSALGTFGQTRQMGAGLASPFGGASTPGGGFANGGGFASAATGGGFASAATGGGFASAATGGGFASAATGGGFASAAIGVGSAGPSASGFAGVAGGFQSFGGNPSGGGGFGAFGGGASGFGGSSTPPVLTPLFTQMRK